MPATRAVAGAVRAKRRPGGGQWRRWATRSVARTAAGTGFAPIGNKTLASGGGPAGAEEPRSSAAAPLRRYRRRPRRRPLEAADGAQRGLSSRARVETAPPATAAADRGGRGWPPVSGRRRCSAAVACGGGGSRRGELGGPRPGGARMRTAAACRAVPDAGTGAGLARAPGGRHARPPPVRRGVRRPARCRAWAPPPRRPRGAAEAPAPAAAAGCGALASGGGCPSARGSGTRFWTRQDFHRSKKC